jgi:hypothetical protein
MATKPTVLGPEAIQLPADSSANRPSPTQGMLRYNTDIGLAEVYTSAGWTAIDAPPGITSISGIINENVSTTLTVNGTNFKSGSYVQIGGAGVSNTPRVLGTTYVNSTQLTAVTNASLVSYVGGASFDVTVVNPSGLSGVLTAAGTIDRTLVWSTAAGSLGTLYGGASANISLSASDGDSQSISFSVTSGSLPSGLSLSSSGVITGTVPDTTATSSFTVTAITNTTGISVARAFSISTVKRLLAVNGTTYYNTGSTQTVTLSSAGTVYPITVYSTHSLRVTCAGAKGGNSSSSSSNSPGGYGAVMAGTYSSIPVGTYYAVVGASGFFQSSGVVAGGYPGGGPSNSNGGQTGGGFSGFWSGTSDPLNTGNRSTYYLIGGGGGGAGDGDTPNSGNAGYPAGGQGNYNSANRVAQGGSQSSGGVGGIDINGSSEGCGDGSAFYGGANGNCGNGGGSGGGGYYGGGGMTSHCGQGGGMGGGGSSYYNSSYISSPSYDGSGAGSNNGSGYVTLAIG